MKYSKKSGRQQLEEWKEAVKKRDGYKCIICGKAERLNAHHLISERLLITRYDVMNGVSLCPNHHRLSSVISAHNGSILFLKWMREHRKEQLEYVEKIAVRKAKEFEKKALERKD